MENSIKINCNDATYVCKFHSNTNFSKNNSLLVGGFTNKLSSFNLYRSILNFHIPDLKSDSIKEAYLFLFLEDIKYIHNGPENLILLGNSENIDIPNANWTNFPNNNFTKPVILSMPNTYVGSYLKVDVTSIIKSLVKFNMNYNIILTPPNKNSNAIFKLASSMSYTPPYLNIVTYAEDNIEFSEASEITENIEAIENDTYENTSENVTKNINDKSSVLDENQSDILPSIKNELINILLKKILP
ncbi:hypothetical protein DFH83_000268 [Clostridium saccharobutylicum]|uniref:DNRLRE domain-containing protein n=1 Tax=Clostridium saccharobutylicum TaxID=169679 RepID=UPI00149434E3|nr:DNRLRE domain-containing protein [Clostridium saccharobutylicum]NOW58288.1 hypothetical protein [Clostridium saccharobutylicum]